MHPRYREEMLERLNTNIQMDMLTAYLNVQARENECLMTVGGSRPPIQTFSCVKAKVVNCKWEAVNRREG